uniref:DUF4276 family protein n=1 Tax=Candidatus Kentrum sp. LPFa TaxID=2126335 RepID=A0A450W4A3_9GAMM|nr:MAG: hypothetical protein BECKLPF1236B_GA0070989_102610 [Candidatus Kentron sp. LPFa]
MNQSGTHKLALFVEGQTEQIFVEKLIRFLGKGASVAIQVERMKGSKRPNDHIEGFITPVDEKRARVGWISAAHPPGGGDWWMRFAYPPYGPYDRLISEGFHHIIGIRDVYPHHRKDIDQIRKGFQFGLRTDPIAPALILAIMEIEAWLLSEYSHFPRIHPGLTPQRIRQAFGFDPAADDMRLRDHPAKDLEAIYFLETITYDKSRQAAERTINNLDFSRIRDEVAARFGDLRRLVELIRTFFDYPRRSSNEPLPQS